MKTLSYSLIVKNEPTLTPESKERLASYYQEKKQIASPAAATKTYNKIFNSVPPMIELNIKKGKVFIVLCSDWACTVIGRSLTECVASFSSFHEEVYLQLDRPIAFRFLEDESLEGLVKKERRQGIIKVLVAGASGVLISEALRRLVMLLQFLRAK